MVYVPVPDEATAMRLAETLVAERLAACANLFPAGFSVYEWEGKICKEPERILMLKTSDERYAALSRRIKALHPYTVPAILKWPIAEANTDYLEWMRGVLNP
jgi:periplasmic divalent cation tolerance protein